MLYLNNIIYNIISKGAVHTEQVRQAFIDQRLVDQTLLKRLHAVLPYEVAAVHIHACLQCHSNRFFGCFNVFVRRHDIGLKRVQGILGQYI